MQVDEFENLTKWFKTNVWELAESVEDIGYDGSGDVADTEEDVGSSADFYDEQASESIRSRAQSLASASYDYDPWSDAAKREKLKDEQILFEHIVGLDKA